MRFKHFGGAGLPFSPSREVYRLSQMVRENPVYTIPGVGDLAIVLYNNELSSKSYREISKRCIQAFVSGYRPGPLGIIDIESVSRDLNVKLVYQVDFSYLLVGKPDLFVLRIYEVSARQFSIAIQQKLTPSSLPLGSFTASGPNPTIWSRNARF